VKCREHLVQLKYSGLSSQLSRPVVGVARCVDKDHDETVRCSVAGVVGCGDGHSGAMSDKPTSTYSVPKQVLGLSDRNISSNPVSRDGFSRDGMFGSKKRSGGC